jgi:hypothetical protein
MYAGEAVGFRLIGIPLWLPMLVSGAALAAGLRARRRRAPMARRTCGYDCCATPGRCPECGTPIPTLRALLRRLWFHLMLSQMRAVRTD